mmetsp:Transcript_16124/g.30392  ORF Transcript_16124/g.30392 Transcript_16124/m.30392 type:complete len:355 (+) Transcript_16124:144-1208(+)|eukprot:CAMPEP_0201674228 /NCGR_PEP_ID=MMETSP0494-20130426/36569_1 /ASSEMBLY_ACC=CAM_ASM_000839 /TAXON_ID=420259 /ORGANISM="Thalassiosira gravida, Strain GMp14c1" /LENGTH=354 /DNA_ID=CAMNT_0048156321 /DNA_START=120 /DNA_END=1184 /DNA_ORIENTATION=+
MISFLLLLSAVYPVAGTHELRSLTVPNFWSSRPRLIAAFGNPKFFTDKYIPSDKPGVVLKFPNFDALFDEIVKVSPMAKQALTEDNPGGIKAINAADDVYRWKVTDSNPKRLVSHIDKIDNFQNKGVPIVRFRSSLRGPTKRRAECFSELISVQHLRQKWDVTCAIVDTIYDAASLDEVKKLQKEKYGEPTLFGIGYVKTKQSVVSPREQLTLCGCQNFPNGASVVWGMEMEEDQNYLFPKNQLKRMPRSTSHIWAVTFIPTGEETFDVEYVLQLEIGGFPGWLTGPVLVETIKKTFRFADDYFKSGLDGGDLAKRLALFPDEEVVIMSDPGESISETTDAGLLDKEQTLLMPP